MKMLEKSSANAEEAQALPLDAFSRSASVRASAASNTFATAEPLNRRYLLAKRALDLTFSLIVFAPLALIVAVAAICIRLDSSGPIFFRQRRIGKDGVPFDMLKLRTMYADSDDSPHRTAIERFMRGEALNESGAGLAYKLGNDPRITRVGSFLRRTGLDELPQFWNVLRGEMSLVGPRPPLPYEAELYTPRDRERLNGAPGLTGPWQVYGRSRVPFDEMVEMDIAYLRRQSILEDLKLIALTVPVMLLGRGGA